MKKLGFNPRYFISRVYILLTLRKTLSEITMTHTYQSFEKENESKDEKIEKTVYEKSEKTRLNQPLFTRRGQCIVHACTLVRACMHAKSLQSCSTLCSHIECTWDSPVKNTRVGCHALLQGISRPRDWTWVSYVSCTAADSLPLVSPENLCWGIIWFEPTQDM